jgi:hypothetical protein
VRSQKVPFFDLKKNMCKSCASLEQVKSLKVRFVQSYRDFVFTSEEYHVQNPEANVFDIEIKLEELSFGKDFLPFFEVATYDSVEQVITLNGELFKKGN